MFDTLSFAELDAEHLELLPARTVLSLMWLGHGHGGGQGLGNGGNGGFAIAVAGPNISNNINVLGNQAVNTTQTSVPVAIGGAGGAGGGGGAGGSGFNVCAIALCRGR